ncbi:hypothetical protein C8F01DRAFT_1228814 [Mycena amicta]|nr:hypothetical protein C8F01DRAFT_1228814 [Mycena amicta]
MSASTPETRAADRARLSAVNVQIEQLQLALGELRSTRTLIQARLESYTYPVLTLPNEIVSEIFIQYIPIYPVCPPLLGDGSPTKLAQICRHWREIAHATPALWRAIELFAMFDSSEDGDALQLLTAQTWLDRSRTLPLSIAMGNDYAGDRGQALNHLLAHRTRWEYVGLRLSNEAEVKYPSRLEGSMPLLLELDLRFEDISWLDTIVGAIDAPRLSTAFLDCCNLQQRQKQLRELLPWGQLTRLLLKWVEIRTAAIILCETPNLVHCRLHLVTESSSDSRILHLPQLQTLDIPIGPRITQSEDVYNLLLNVRAPGLQRLRFDEFMMPQAGDSENLPIALVIKAFACKLERVCIGRAVKSLQEYKTALPEVRYLELCDWTNIIPGNSEVWGHPSW